VHFGELKALEYQGLVAGAFEDIESDPERGRRQVALRPEGLRTLDIAKPGRDARHLFVYRIVDAGSVVELIGFLHDAMDFQRHIPKRLQRRPKPDR
jgi:plasmid stabilization system protein ParE